MRDSVRLLVGTRGRCFDSAARPELATPLKEEDHDGVFLDHLIGTIQPEYSSAEESNFQIQQGPRQARNTIPGGHQSMPAFLPGTPALRGLNLRQKPPGRIR